MPTLEELDEMYHDGPIRTLFIPHREGLERVRDAMAAWAYHHAATADRLAREQDKETIKRLKDEAMTVRVELQALIAASKRETLDVAAERSAREKAEQTADALRREVETITADRDTLESYYQKVTKVALDCSPIPASQRPDNQIEPPWEVFARMKSERDAAKGALEFAMQKTDEFRQWLTGKR